MKNQTKNIVLSAVFVAIVSALSQVAIPLAGGVAITLQTFAVSLLGFMLPASYSALAVLTYIILGTLGVPVFANFRGGADVLIGPSGGFIVGFLALAVFCSLGNNSYLKALKILLPLIGLIICHILGVLMFAFVMKKDIFLSIKLVSLPFIVKDIISVFGAYCVKDKLKTIFISR